MFVGFRTGGNTPENLVLEDVVLEEFCYTPTLFVKYGLSEEGGLIVDIKDGKRDKYSSRGIDWLAPNVEEGVNKGLHLRGKDRIRYYEVSEAGTFTLRNENGHFLNLGTASLTGRKGSKCFSVGFWKEPEWRFLSEKEAFRIQKELEKFTLKTEIVRL